MDDNKEERHKKEEHHQKHHITHKEAHAKGHQETHSGPAEAKDKKHLHTHPAEYQDVPSDEHQASHQHHLDHTEHTPQGDSQERITQSDVAGPTIQHQPRQRVSPILVALVVVAAALVIFNQYQLSQVAVQLHVPSKIGTFMQKTPSFMSKGSDLKEAVLEPAQSTAHTVKQLFDLEGKSGDEVMAAMFPSGTPEYGDALGVSFDDPVNSLATLANMLPSIKAQVERENPEAFARYVNLASQPYGVSCEYCCGVGPAGADKKGNSRCGCQHNPALLALTLYLASNTDYSDAEILYEVMRWKTLFFPQKMIELGGKIAGGDAAVLQKLPGMVGGC